jgi:predicted nucleotidyltransferase component of viral defense system
VKLFEHRDFEQAILQAAEHFRAQGLRPAIIEKDYYVTEALRVIASSAGDKVIFKGGTSLLKGWNLIQRFSEDIDRGLHAEARKERHRPGTQATPRCRRSPSGPDLRQ